MAYQKFNIRTELTKFVQGRKTEVEPCVLLMCIADDYLDAATPICSNDSVGFLERLYGLDDTRG